MQSFSNFCSLTCCTLHLNIKCKSSSLTSFFNMGNKFSTTFKSALPAEGGDSWINWFRILSSFSSLKGSRIEFNTPELMYPITSPKTWHAELSCKISFYTEDMPNPPNVFNTIKTNFALFIGLLMEIHQQGRVCFISVLVDARGFRTDEAGFLKKFFPQMAFFPHLSKTHHRKYIHP